MKSVLITGATDGLGKSLALVFAENGYNVAINGRSIIKLKRIKKIIERNNVNCCIVYGDINLDTTINKIFEVVKKKRVNIIINNAGINSQKMFNKINEKELMDILNTNLISPIKITHKVYPLFVKRKSGTIININSIEGFRPNIYKSIYCASKYGLKGFTDSLNFEAKKNNIKVLGVYLSGMKTKMYKATGKDMSNCMETLEVSKLIYNNCESYSTAGVDELIIHKTRFI